MAVFVYNVETPSKNLTVSEPGHRIFTDKLTSKNSPRKAWDEMMLFLQKENILNRKRLHPEPVFVKINSIEALQCKNEKEFDSMVSKVIKYGGQLYSLAEEAVFNKDYPHGISNNPEKLEKAKAEIRAKSAAYENAANSSQTKKRHGPVISI